MTERRRILVVDDEEDIRQIIGMTLALHYDVVEARDGQEALEIIADVEPDLVIMDLAMPHIDGFETTAAIRAMPQFRQLDVMFLTSTTDRAAMLKSYESGASLYLTKPFEPARVLKNVALFFEKSPAPPRKKYAYDELKRRLQEGRERRTPASDARVASKPKMEPVTAAAAPAPEAPAAAQSEEQRRQLQAAIENARRAQQQMDFNKRPPTGEHSEHISRQIGGETKKKNNLKFRVLIVDSDAHNFTVARAALAPRVEVVYAATVDDAQDKMTRFEPDILVLDGDSKELEFQALLAHARDLPHLRNAPALLAMKKASEREREQALDLGILEVIGRPFAEREIRTVIEDLTLTPSFKPAEKKLLYEQIKNV